MDDDCSLHEVRAVLNHLDSLKAVHNVYFTERPPATAADISAWEAEHAPLRLPQDLKDFLLVSNGLELRWNVQHLTEALPLGCMHLNSISQLLPCADEVTHDEFGRLAAELPAATERVVDLDTKCEGGRVCLVPCGRAEMQVWFQDLACRWSFIANSFTDYFRLMVLHLGLPRWQYAYTEVGLDPIARQWARLVAPERLALVPGTNGAVLELRHAPALPPTRVK